MKRRLVVAIGLSLVGSSQTSEVGQFFIQGYSDALAGKFGSFESVSGPGSSLKQTQFLRSWFPSLIKQLNITSILDAPCGDFNWMQCADLGNCSYIGVDVVPLLIEKNNNLYRSASRTFTCADLITDTLPYADLIIARDFLVHLSNANIWKAIANFKRSGAKYLLTTTFINRANYDISSGDWRPLCLRQAPFNFPEPILIICEHCTEQGGVYADKSMGLWNLSEITIPESIR